MQRHALAWYQYMGAKELTDLPKLSRWALMDQVTRWQLVTSHAGVGKQGVIGGKEVFSTFSDGIVGSYSPSLPEVVLGLGGVALALAATFAGARVLRFMPVSLADEAVDPHYTAKEARQVISS